MNGEFSKALESYTKALMLKPGDKSCLVARSKCYLHIGDPVSALKVSDLWEVSVQSRFFFWYVLYFWFYAQSAMTPSTSLIDFRQLR